MTMFGTICSAAFPFGVESGRFGEQVSRTTSQMLIVFNLILSIVLSQDFTNGEYFQTILNSYCYFDDDSKRSEL